jgi:transposase
MASFSTILVDIPKDVGIHIKSAGAKGERYVYKYIRYFRNENGQPRNQAKAIGKYDPDTGKMHPNSYFFELYHLDPALTDLALWDYGYSYVVLSICHELGLFEYLSQAFGKKAMDIIAIAAYIIREGNAVYGIDDWLKRNYFPNHDRHLDSQSCSSLFASITPSQLSNFFKSWVKAALSGGSVYYDVTSISSYAREIPAVELGYNRDGDNLAQFNLGMFCDDASRIPLYYNLYNGSLTDKTNLSYVLANAKSVGIERVKMVLDGGFWSKECFDSLHSSCQAFTVGMPMHLKEAMQICDRYEWEIEHYANELPYPHVYCVPIDTEVYGVPGRACLYYDAWNHLNLCMDLSDHISKLSAELSQLKRLPKKKLSRYSPYFILSKHKDDSGFDYSIDYEKVEELRKRNGFFLIFTTDGEATPAQILEHYRAKDAAEKLFAQIKVDMDCGRMRTHNGPTSDGKAFVTFIACVIRACLLGKLSKYLTDNSTSMPKVFSQLSDISIISSNSGYLLTKALTKKQKEILSACSAAEIVDSIKQICLR